MSEIVTRIAKSTRPQLVCVLADNSLSMRGPKAQKATEAIRDLIMECQTRGRDIFQLLLIRFSDNAEIDSQCNMVSANKVDSDAIELLADRHHMNITHALELTYDCLKPYVSGLQAHPEKERHPLPIIILFSDGEHNVGPHPKSIAAKIKQLNVDGDPVRIISVGVDAKDSYDAETLKEIATDGIYVDLSDPEQLFDVLCPNCGPCRPTVSLEEIVRRFERSGHDPVW